MENVTNNIVSIILDRNIFIIIRDITVTNTIKVSPNFTLTFIQMGKTMSIEISGFYKSLGQRLGHGRSKGLW